MSVAMRLSYKQDIKDPLVTQAPVTLLMQGDNQANVIELTLMDGTTPASLSGYTATVYLQRSDGVRVRCPGSVSGNVATVPLQAECYSVPGQYAAIMKLSGPNELRTVLRLAGYVESDGQGVIIDPSGSIPSYEDLERITQELEEALQQAETAISGANAAAQNANEKAAIADTAAGNANTAAGNANAGAGRANEAAGSIEGLTVEASDVAYDHPATAEVSDVGGHKHIAFGLRQGVPGAVPNITFTGETGEPNTDVVITQSGPPEAPVVNLKIPQGVPGTGNVSTVDGVVPDSGGNVALSAVRYVAQTLEDAQKVQVRKNIGVDGQVYPCTTQALEAMSQEQQAELYTQGYRAVQATNNETVVTLALAADGALSWQGCNEDTANLLDNPNFAIAQAGYGGMHGSQIYAADRWIGLNTASAQYADGMVNLTDNGTGNCAVVQAMDSGEGGEFTVNADITPPSGGKWQIVVFNLETGMPVIISSSNGDETKTPILNVTVPPNIKIWVGLYPTVGTPNGMGIVGNSRLLRGSYTAKTLPPWQEPDYDVEMIKCQYFYRRDWVSYQAFAPGSSFPGFSYPFKMRVNPTVNIYDESGNIGYIGVWGQQQAYKVTYAPATNERLYYINTETAPQTVVSCVYLIESIADL